MLGTDELPNLVVAGSIPERGANQSRRDQGSEEALTLRATVRVRTALPYIAKDAPLAQLAEASGLSPDQSQFESVVEHQLSGQPRIYDYRPVAEVLFSGLALLTVGNGGKGTLPWRFAGTLSFGQTRQVRPP